MRVLNSTLIIEALEYLLESVLTEMKYATTPQELHEMALRRDEIQDELAKFKEEAI